MGKVFSAPKELPPPVWDINVPFTANQAAQSEYVTKVAEWARQNGSGEFAGEEVRFGVADGYARYIVLSTKPVQLIHLRVGDEWHFEYANRLTAKDIKEQLQRKKLFARGK